MSVKLHSIGIMSGSSLDGLDIAHCVIKLNPQAKSPQDFRREMRFEIPEAKEVKFSTILQNALKSAPQLSISELAELDSRFGLWIGQQIVEHFDLTDIQFIASHGHTVLHNPARAYSLQIGSGAQIAAATQRPVICDFRNTDIALGGQGAPLAPMVEYYLFPQYSHFVNLGGIANLGIIQDDHIRGFDICVCNQALNHLAGHIGQDYDDRGKMAAQGRSIPSLLGQLNGLPYLKLPAPKSMSNEDVQNTILPILDNNGADTRDKLHTVTQHISYQIAQQLLGIHPTKILITGGGAYNDFLVHSIEQRLGHKIPRASDQVIRYKETLLMSLLGTLRWLKINNIAKSVTGAQRDSCSGAVYLP